MDLDIQQNRVFVTHARGCVRITKSVKKIMLMDFTIHYPYCSYTVASQYNIDLADPSFLFSNLVAVLCSE